MSIARVEYGEMTFDAETTLAEDITLGGSLMFDEMPIDEVELDVISNDLGDRKFLTLDDKWYTTKDGLGYVFPANDIRRVRTGDFASFFINNILRFKMFIKTVERLGFNAYGTTNAFKLTFQNVVGLLDKRRHYGGIYTGQSAGDVIADIFGDLDVIVDNDVAAVPVYNYLPIASARENLRDLLMVLGAILTYGQNGRPRVLFLKNLQPISISDDDIDINESTTYDTPVTKVIVTEHSYYESDLDAQVSLFDNTDGSGSVSHKIVEFANPCHGLEATGLTVHESGANYAVVSGTGTLTGYEYTHSMRLFERSTGKTGEERIASVENITLVSALNSANIAARVADYLAIGEINECSIVLGSKDIRPGTLLSYNDPDGDPSQGLVQEAAITLSETDVALCRIVKGYLPDYFGNNYQNYDLLTGSGTYTVPAGVTKMRIIVVQAGTGGGCGYAGQSSQGGDPGQGGQPGEPGSAGKVFALDIDVSPGETFSYSCGTGGLPGTTAGEAGQPGGETTFGQYTSEDGEVPANGIVNILTGDVYAKPGKEGTPGAPGGPGGSDKYGESVTDGQQMWPGGRGCNAITNSRGEKYSWAGGGGAAHGNAGGDADPGEHAGHGADADAPTEAASLGSGGPAGHGGGGAGEGMAEYSQNLGKWIYWGSKDGHGGQPSAGLAGGNGFILVLR